MFPIYDLVKKELFLFMYQLVWGYGTIGFPDHQEAMYD